MRQENLDGTDVQRRPTPLAPSGRFANEGCTGLVFEHHQRMAQVDTPFPSETNQTEKRGLEALSPGYVKQGSARPERGVKRREDVVGGLHGIGQQVAFQ